MSVSRAWFADSLTWYIEELALDSPLELLGCLVLCAKACIDCAKPFLRSFAFLERLLFQALFLHLRRYFFPSKNRRACSVKY